MSLISLAGPHKCLVMCWEKYPFCADKWHSFHMHVPAVYWIQHVPYHRPGHICLMMYWEKYSLLWCPVVVMVFMHSCRHVKWYTIQHSSKYIYFSSSSHELVPPFLLLPHIMQYWWTPAIIHQEPMKKIVINYMLHKYYELTR